jgi:predicted  nucleic acid-binding Zn-ribbon protein
MSGAPTVNADLERLIALQQLDTSAQDAERRIAEAPAREKALDARLESAQQRVADAKAHLAENQTARRAIEKDVAVSQGRLSKFRDQLMEVKTNREYQAMQKEIEVAQTEVKAMEETLLERMLEADELAAIVKRAEAELAAEQKTCDADRRALTAELAELNASLERLRAQRTELTRAVEPPVLATFELVARRRNGIGVAEARNGICTICHVRLRPQVFNTIRNNESIIQCDSCQRILYFLPAAATTPDNVSQSAP